MTDEFDTLLSLSAVAKRTGTSVAFWRKRIARHEIPVVLLGRCVRVRESDLQAWIRLGLGSPHRSGHLPPREPAR